MLLFSRRSLRASCSSDVLTSYSYSAANHQSKCLSHPPSPCRSRGIVPDHVCFWRGDCLISMCNNKELNKVQTISAKSSTKFHKEFNKGQQRVQQSSNKFNKEFSKVQQRVQQSSIQYLKSTKRSPFSHCAIGTRATPHLAALPAVVANHVKAVFQSPQLYK